jgi:hypothetical protein
MRPAKLTSEQLFDCIVSYCSRYCGNTPSYSTIKAILATEHGIRVSRSTIGNVVRKLEQQNLIYWANNHMIVRGSTWSYTKPSN